MSGAKKRWEDLAPAQRVGVCAALAVDLGLRTWALADVARRPAAQVRGSKAAWAVVLGVVGSGGVVPVVYLVRGRRRDR